MTPVQDPPVTFYPVRVTAASTNQHLLYQSKPAKVSTDIMYDIMQRIIVYTREREHPVVTFDTAVQLFVIHVTSVAGRRAKSAVYVSRVWAQVVRFCLAPQGILPLLAINRMSPICIRTTVGGI